METLSAAAITAAATDEIHALVSPKGHDMSPVEVLDTLSQGVTRHLIGAANEAESNDSATIALVRCC